MKGEFQLLRERLVIIAVTLSSCVVVAGCAVRSAHENPRLRNSNLPKAQANSLSSNRQRQEASQLFFLDERIGWVVSNGTLYGTKNGGEHWQRLYSTDPGHSVEVFFANEQEGWMTINQWSGKPAHLVLRTTNGGHEWRQLLNLESPIYTIHFVSNRTGFVRDRWEPIRQTLDGGEIWKELNLPDGPERSNIFEGLQYFFFINEKEGWGYESGIWHTIDSGQTWQEVVREDTTKGMLSSSSFVDETHGWIVGSGRQIWRTTDGNTWQRAANIPSALGPVEEISRQLPSALYSVSFVNSKEGWVAANDRTVLHSTDGGDNWEIIFRWSSDLRALRFLSATEGWAIDDEGQLLRTTDGGRNWDIRILSL